MVEIPFYGYLAIAFGVIVIICFLIIFASRRPCSKCGKMRLLTKCGREECKYEFCSECAEKTFKECSKCGGLYCNQHISNHTCEPDEDKESDEEESDVVSYFGGEYVVLQTTNMDKKDISIIKEYRDKGYSVLLSIAEANYNGATVMVRDKEKS
jgi:hypothetical protein